jgi:hypothetical protein
MGFLRRILGGGSTPGPEDPPEPGDGGTADEQARERELLLEEARRLDDELIQRQLRYADRAWTPPAQGGPRRADDGDGDGDDGGR